MQQLHLRTTKTVEPVGQSPNVNSIRILRLPDVMLRVGLKRSSIYQYINTGDFPQPVSLGPRAVGWFEHEIEAWLNERAQIRNKSRGSIGGFSG